MVHFIADLKICLSSYDQNKQHVGGAHDRTGREDNVQVRPHACSWNRGARARLVLHPVGGGGGAGGGGANKGLGTCSERLVVDIEVAKKNCVRSRSAPGKTAPRAIPHRLPPSASALSTPVTSVPVRFCLGRLSSFSTVEGIFRQNQISAERDRVTV